MALSRPTHQRVTQTVRRLLKSFDKTMILALIIISVALLIIIGIGALILVQSGDLLVFVFATGASALFITFLTSLYFRDKHILARKIQKVCKIIFTITIMNFVSFIVVGILIGGSAPNGKIEGGHYFLGDHGHYREVPYIIYLYSLIHTYSVFITHPLAMLAGWIHAMTGGDRRIKIKPDILKLLPQKRNISGENQLPKSKA